MGKLVLTRIRKRESKSGNIAVKVRSDTYEIINKRSDRLFCFKSCENISGLCL